MDDVNLIEHKWQMIDSVVNEIEMIKKLEENNENSVQLEEIQKKLVRLKNLKNYIEKDEQSLKLDYLILMRERNLYFEKLKMVQAVGEEREWKSEDGQLEAIRKMLFAYGKESQSGESTNR